MVTDKKLILTPGVRFWAPAPLATASDCQGGWGQEHTFIVVVEADGRLGGVVEAMSDGAMDVHLKSSSLWLLLGGKVTPLGETLDQGSKSTADRSQDVGEAAAGVQRWINSKRRGDDTTDNGLRIAPNQPVNTAMQSQSRTVKDEEDDP